MKFYRVSYSAEGGNSGGYSWHTSRMEAEKAVADAVANDPDEYKVSERPEPELVEIKPTKAGILSALRTYAAHPDNG